MTSAGRSSPDKSVGDTSLPKTSCPMDLSPSITALPLTRLTSRSALGPPYNTVTRIGILSQQPAYMWGIKQQKDVIAIGRPRQVCHGTNLSVIGQFSPGTLPGRPVG